MNFEEKAFYAIPKALTIKYDFEYPEEKLLLLSKEVKKVEEGFIGTPVETSLWDPLL